MINFLKLLRISLILANLDGFNYQVDGLPLAIDIQTTRPDDGLLQSPQTPLFELNGRQNFEDEEDADEEDEGTTVKGPGHEGILLGLSGILSNIVKGDANGVVESTFNFVPPVYQKDVNSAYNTIIGRTTTTARPSSTPPALKGSQKVLNGAQKPWGTAVDETEEETTQKRNVGGSGGRRRPERRPAGSRPISSGDDEEDDRVHIVGVRRKVAKPQVYKEVVHNAESPDDDLDYHYQPFQFQ